MGALLPLWPVFLSYALSYVYLGIYWNNHHHMLHATRHISGGVLWANLHLLFWLSLVPFVTGWMGESHFAPQPTAIYGVGDADGGDGVLDPAEHDPADGRARFVAARAVGRDRKGKLSPILYVLAIGAAFVKPGDRRRAIRNRGADLGDSGSPHRARAGRRPRASVPRIAETAVRRCASGPAAGRTTRGADRRRHRSAPIQVTMGPSES